MNTLKSKTIQIKRFKSTFESNNNTIEAHLPNTGSMRTLNAPGLEAWLTHVPGGGRKLAYRVEAIVTPEGVPVGVYSARANRVVRDAIEAGRIEALSGYGQLQAEVRCGDSRFDFFLSGHAQQPDAFVEVKSVQMSRTPGVGEFPDAVTARGLKHLQGLIAVRKQGLRAVLIFCAQRSDVAVIRPAADIDPAYAAGLRAARAEGVEVLGVNCCVAHTPEAVNVYMQCEIATEA